MKKYIPGLLLGVLMLGGCSYWQKADFSWANPFHKTEVAGVVEAPVEVKPAVNAFLWQAALDKTSFMPKVSENPQTGEIVTGWSDVGKSQYRLEIKIDCKELRADGVHVSGYKRTVFGRQSVDEPISRGMSLAIEQSILSRARVLYARSLAD